MSKKRCLDTTWTRRARGYFHIRPPRIDRARWVPSHPVSTCGRRGSNWFDGCELPSICCAKTMFEVSSRANMRSAQLPSPSCTDGYLNYDLPRGFTIEQVYVIHADAIKGHFYWPFGS